MPFVPEWAPNLHPMIVHFPIAILFLALIFDLAAIIFRNVNWFRYSAGSLFIVGAVFTIAIYFSGNQAADTVNPSALAIPVLSDHADLALITVWFFSIYAIVRFIILWKDLNLKWFYSLFIFLIGAIGAFFLFETAEHGAELVYRFGVGVNVSEDVQSTEIEKRNGDTVSSIEGIVETDNNSWSWNPGPSAKQVLEKDFVWLIGNVTEVNPSVVNDSGNHVLTFNMQNSTALFTAGKSIESVQADVQLNLDSFNGTFMLVHHVQDSMNYDFISIVNSQLILGRMQNSSEEILSEETVKTKGWFSLRTVGDGSHYRGYIDEKMIIHGHTDELPPGPVGFFVHGSGTIFIDNLIVQSLR